MSYHQIGGNFNPELIQGLVDNYRNFLAIIELEEPINRINDCQLSETIPDTLTCQTLIANEIDTEFIDINDLQIETNLREINKFYNLCGIIQLRPFRGQNVLIIGCGNYRLNDAGGYSFLNSTMDKQEYYQYHNHHDEYTVDIDLAANPSTIADLSQQKLCNVPDKSFQFIIAEGGGPDFDDFFIRELDRLLKDHNSFYIGIDEGTYKVQLYKREGNLYIPDN